MNDPWYFLSRSHSHILGNEMVTSIQNGNAATLKARSGANLTLIPILRLGHQYKISGRVILVGHNLISMYCAAVPGAATANTLALCLVNNGADQRVVTRTICYFCLF